MGKREKALAKFRQNPKNVRFEELEIALLHFGFEKRQGSGSHVTYTYKKYPPLTVPIRRPFLKPKYVLLALQVLDEILEQEQLLK